MKDGVSVFSNMWHQNKKRRRFVDTKQAKSFTSCG